MMHNGNNEDNYMLIMAVMILAIFSIITII